MNPQIFRMYDIRGKYPGQINEREVFDITSRMKAIFPAGKTIVIGRDARNSSPSLYLSLRNGLTAAGFKVVATGLMITPMIDFFVRHFGADGGIVVTASHNPKDHNGLYIIDSTGANIGGLDIHPKIRNLNPKIKLSKERSQLLDEKEGVNHKIYADFMSSKFLVKKPMRVVIDCSNGSAGPILKKLKFPRDVHPILINAILDGNFPAHGPDPMAKGALRDASVAVIKNKADLGIVFDGDGDRAFVIDNLGREVLPEYAWKLIDSMYPENKVVYSVLSSYAMNILKSKLPELKAVKLVETKVGHIFIKRVCFKEKNAVGVETSMHYYMPQDGFAGSGILTMIAAINACSQLPYSLSEFVSMMPKIYRIPEHNINLDLKKLPALYKKIKKHFSKTAIKIENIDGLSIFGKGWWFNIRPSNTEDIVRINIDGDEKELAKKLERNLISQIKNS